ncbi:hypothetical protein AUC61_17840 [Pseudomonas sp. S25]|uniref:Cyclodeaminase/cyclohydrolase domain-containing protein n=1 Tax=Pseudomonas maioricensis TaxID=1766623 RepID=A0ABS9ZLF3_9PSED|nr:cyclodeaminase/cyclohydrolase family protein [Pseudomonas sp. S25]MCI8211393.1 hypothetical protein [Pseudomonas sp. S25]
MSLWSTTLESWLEQVSADTPVPSCGATVSVCANLGLGLLLMALRNAQRKHPAPERMELIGSCERLTALLAAHADNDMRTFQAYIDELSEKGGVHTQELTLGITLASLAAARSCHEGLCLAEQALPWVMKHMRSDVTSAALIVHASLCALLLNVDADRAGLEQHDDVPDPIATRLLLQQEADQALRRIKAASIA